MTQDTALRHAIKKAGKVEALKAVMEGLEPWEQADLLRACVNGHHYLLLTFGTMSGSRKILTSSFGPHGADNDSFQQWMVQFAIGGPDVASMSPRIAAGLDASAVDGAVHLGGGLSGRPRTEPLGEEPPSVNGLYGLDRTYGLGEGQ